MSKGKSWDATEILVDMKACSVASKGTINGSSQKLAKFEASILRAFERFYMYKESRGVAFVFNNRSGSAIQKMEKVRQSPVHEVLVTHCTSAQHAAYRAPSEQITMLFCVVPRPR